VQCVVFGSHVLEAIKMVKCRDAVEKRTVSKICAGGERREIGRKLS